MWFSASLLVSIETNNEDGPYTVYENIVLVEARSREEGMQRALQFGSEEEVDDPSLTLNGSKAEYKFIGVRKLILINNLSCLNPESSLPTAGTEISYSRYTLETKDDLLKLASGDEVNLCYIE